MNIQNIHGGRIRNNQVKVMLSDKEYKHFLKQVEKIPYSKSTYLREVIAGKEIKQRQPDEYFEVRRMVSNMTNNINQIARIANTCGQVDQGQIQVLLQLVQKCWFHIRDL